jgi:hypothetical protein
MASNDKATRGHYERIDYDRPSDSLVNPSITIPDDLVEELDQSLSLLLTAETSTPAATGKPLLSIIAPATLPEGYAMDVQVNGRGQLCAVMVPPGGVKEGQTLRLPYQKQQGALRRRRRIGYMEPLLSLM